SFSFPCVMVSCPQYVRTINLPEFLPMCLKCHVVSAKKLIKYGKNNADTKFYISIKDPSSWVYITLNQRVTGSSPVAPTTQLIENFTTFRFSHLRRVYTIQKRFQRGSKCVSHGSSHRQCQIP